MVVLPWSEPVKREALRVRCLREIDYSIVHPSRPVLDLVEPALRDAVAGRPVLIVCDKNVWRSFGEQIAAYAERHLQCLGKITVHGSEQRKEWSQIRNICSAGLRAGLPRNGVIIAFGGGVTLDLAGMAASLYRRGISYIRVPTTLVGIVDTAIGIKQGFNFKSRKNLLGTFYPPDCVINDASLLRTLAAAEISCGLAEIIKIAVVRDPVLVDLLVENVEVLLASKFQSPANLAMQILLRAEQAMLEELQPNLFETCKARLADFGHTFSPGLERASKYELRHGEAVALDMLLSTALAVRRGLCPESLFDRLARLHRASALPLSSPLMTLELLLCCAQEARLHRSGDLNLVVPTDFGRATYLQEITREDLEYGLAMTKEAAHEPTLCRRASAGL